MQRASSLRVESVTLSFGANVAVDDLSLAVSDGEFLGLLGPSGCGKTTLLRMIAGFLKPDRGQIICDGQDISSKPPFERRFGFVFQNYALFPHMTAFENVGYGLRIARVPKKELAKRVERLLAKVGLSDVGGLYPSQLSGGMQQRVALARALVIEPAILLLDEPLSALDKNLREEMQVELRLLQQNLGVTTVFVTHDQEEAMTLSDRIAVMRSGKLLQFGKPEEVYRNPASRFVSTFLGTTNLLSGLVRGTSPTGINVSIDGTVFTVVGDRDSAKPGAATSIAIRPENLIISDDPAGLEGTVADIFFQGYRLIVLFVTKGGQELRVFAPATGWAIEKGATAYANWPEGTARLLND